MKIVKIINDVDRFSTSEKCLCLVKKDSLEVLDFQDLEVLQVYDFKERMEFVYLNEKHIWINSNSGNGFYILDGKLFSRVNYILSIDKDSMLYEISSNGISQINLSNQKLNWTIPVSSLLTKFYRGEVIIRTGVTEVAVFRSDNGEKKWSYNYGGDFDYFTNLSMNEKKKATVSRIIGVHNGVLWVSLSSGRLLGIENLTGELKYNICNPNHTPADFIQRKEVEYLHYGLYMNLDADRNILFGLRGQYYFEIDLSLPESSYTIYDVSVELKKNRFREINVTGNGYENVWNKDKIFFGERDTEGSGIGAFNRITKKITLYVAELDSDSYLPNIQSIRFNNNRLFVLDGKRRLHILSE